MSNTRELGIVVYGVSGFTGRLACKYSNQQYGVDDSVARH